MENLKFTLQTKEIFKNMSAIEHRNQFEGLGDETVGMTDAVPYLDFQEKSGETQLIFLKSQF